MVNKSIRDIMMWMVLVCGVCMVCMGCNKKPMASSPQPTTLSKATAAPDSTAQLAFDRVCSAFADSKADNAVPLAERRRELMKRLQQNGDLHFFNGLLEKTKSWDDLVNAANAKGVAQTDCPPMKSFVEMRLAEKDDTRPGATGSASKDVDHLCYLARQATSDSKLSPDQARMAWVELAAKDTTNAEVRNALLTIFSGTEVNATKVKNALSEALGARFECSALEKLFP